MKTRMTSLRRSVAFGGLTLALGFGVVGLSARPAMAHQTNCPYCRLPVVQDTDQQDNEVALKYGRKRIEYRCVMCAMSQAKTDYKGDVTILAPSEVKGKPVVISRKSGQWSVAPESAVFVSAPGSHKECQTRYRAFTNKAGLDTFVQKHHDLLHDAKPLSISEMVSATK